MFFSGVPGRLQLLLLKALLGLPVGSLLLEHAPLLLQLLVLSLQVLLHLLVTPLKLQGDMAGGRTDDGISTGVAQSNDALQLTAKKVLRHVKELHILSSEALFRPHGSSREP